MLLFDVMRHAECSICLQSLLPSEEPSESPPASEKKEKRLAGFQRRLTSWLQRDSGNLEEEEFRITFAPGVSHVSSAESVVSFGDALEIYNRVKNKTKGKSVRCDTTSHGPFSSIANQGTVVLPCGHMLHFLCAVQLYEYSNNSSCPICRRELKGADNFVIFAPRSRLKITERCCAVNSDSKTVCSGDGNGDGDVVFAGNGNEDVRFAGERRIDPVDAYMRQIQCENDELKRRCKNLSGREHDLTSSRDKLEEQCLSLELSADETRRRYAVLTQQGSVGLERLLELREVARRTHTLMNQLTSELASLTREQVALDCQLEKKNQQLQEFRLSKQRGFSDVDDSGKRNSDGLSPPLQKRRLKDAFSGVGLSYYVSDEQRQ